MKKFLATLEQFAPQIVSFTVPGAGPILAGLIQHGIAVAHGASNPDGSKMTGQQKLALAVEEVMTGVKGVNAVKPGTISEEILTDALSKGIGATYDAVNLIHKSQPAAPPA
jgi:hypothetical protein